MNGSCNWQMCSPLSTVSCAFPNGTGSRQCNAIGTGYGSCNRQSCNSGFVWNGSACVYTPPPPPPPVVDDTGGGSDGGGAGGSDGGGTGGDSGTE